MSCGALTLAMYPFDDVRICCEPCGREGRYRRTRLIERFGGDMSMPEVLSRITEGCPRKRPSLLSGYNSAGTVVSLFGEDFYVPFGRGIGPRAREARSHAERTRNTYHRYRYG